MTKRIGWLRYKGDEGTVTWIGSNLGGWFRGLFMGSANEQQAGGGQQIIPSEAGADPTTVDVAMTLSAVWRCSLLIADTIATLPLGLFERTGAGNSRVPADSLSLANLIARRPNPDMTAVVFWASMILQALLIGNAFAKIHRIGSRITSLELMNANAVTWRLLQNGSFEYRWTKPNGMSETVAEEEIFHLPGVTMWGKFGLPVLVYAARTFGAGIAANQAALRAFKNGLTTNNYFKMERVLTEAQRTEFRANQQRLAGALNAGTYPLLEGGMDVGSFGLTPETLQLLQSRAYSKEEVCTWFGVPPSMIGAGDKASSWASSSESLNQWFLQYTLTPWLKRIEQAIWKDLLSVAERPRFFAEFSTDGLLRSNTAGRMQLYASALQNGWMTRNEVRRLENLPPISDAAGDQFTVQSNLITLEHLGEHPDPGAQQVNDALKAWLGITIGEPREAHDGATH